MQYVTCPTTHKFSRRSLVIIMPSVKLRSILLGAGILSLLVLSTALAVVPARGSGTVTRGFMLPFVSFPGDFSSARRHPLTFEDFIPAGKGILTVVFTSFSGTGVVNVTASSEAFLNETSVSRAIRLEFQPVEFSLPYEVREGINGRFPVIMVVTNGDGKLLDWDPFPNLRVWSKEHIEAADQLLLAQSLLSQASLTSPVQSPEARTLISSATAKQASATSAFFAKEWATALKEAKETIALVRQADQAEASFTQLLRDRESARVEKELAIKEKSNSLEEMRIEAEQRRATLDEQRFQIEAREKSASLITWYLASASLVFLIVAGTYAIFRLSRRTGRL